MSFDRNSIEKIGGRFLVFCYLSSFSVTIIGTVILFISSISYGLLALITIPALILSLIGNFLVYFATYKQIKEDKLW